MSLPVARGGTGNSEGPFYTTNIESAYNCNELLTPGIYDTPNVQLTNGIDGWTNDGQIFVIKRKNPNGSTVTSQIWICEKGIAYRQAFSVYGNTFAAWTKLVEK